MRHHIKASSIESTSVYDRDAAESLRALTQTRQAVENPSRPITNRDRRMGHISISAWEPCVGRTYNHGDGAAADVARLTGSRPGTKQDGRTARSTLPSSGLSPPVALQCLQWFMRSFYGSLRRRRRREDAFVGDFGKTSNALVPFKFGD